MYHRPAKKELPMSTSNQQQTDKSFLLSCIDYRLVQPDAQFISEHGEAFHARLAGGAASVIEPHDQAVALKQVIAAYKLAGVTEIYLESHLDCGAYRLSGATFTSLEHETAQLYEDLDKAAEIVESTLIAAGANPADISVHTRAVDPTGVPQSRPVTSSVKRRS
jgi:carbonic anhydrase